jgi:hypothetical protein
MEASDFAEALIPITRPHGVTFPKGKCKFFYTININARDKEN